MNYIDFYRRLYMGRISNSVRNIKIALLGQLLGIFINIVSRKIFVLFLPIEYLGLNGLFSNILSMLSLAELGIGSAIIYSLYKPIAENKIEEIKSLMRLYKYVYCAVGMFILIAGTSLAPFLELFIKDMPDIPNIRLIYIIFVINTAISYFFTYKRSLIIANQQQYIVVAYHYAFMVLLNIEQIFILYITQNFILYLLLQAINTLLENFSLSRKAELLFPYIRDKNVLPLKIKIKQEIKRNVCAMFFHRIGGAVVFATDNILISKIVGLSAVAIYSNYMLIRTALNAITGQIFQSVSASFGNLNAQGTAQQKLEVFYVMNFAGAWIFGFCSICFFNLINPFITIWLGERYLFSKMTVFLIVLVFYISGMRQPCLTARDAMGLFWYDRFKPLFEIIINLFFSIMLGMKFGVSGIMTGTVISTMTTCFWIEPYVVYKYGFRAPMRTFFMKYILYSSVTLVCAVITYILCDFITYKGIYELVAKMIICGITINIIFLLCYMRTREFKYIFAIIQKII